MAADDLGTDYRCGYCWEVLDSVSEPKLLPCGHVGCKSCLETDIRQKNGVSCPQCRVFHEALDIDTLPKKTIEQPPLSSPNQATPVNLTCDRQECTTNAAVSFCINCGHKLCDTHHQGHEAYFGGEHEVISIDVYKQSPAKYMKVFCTDHSKEVLVRACKKCDRLVCMACDTTNELCAEDATIHMFSGFPELEETINSHYNHLLKSTEDKLTDLGKESKKTWNKLDNEEVRCNKWIEEIKDYRDQQIRLLTEESEKIIQKIQKYLVGITGQVELFDSELLAREEQLTQLRTKVQTLVKHGHVTEKIRKKTETTAEVISDVEIEIGSCELTPNPELIVKSGPVVDFIEIPTSLTDDKVYSANSTSLSTCHKEDGDILLGCVDGLWLFQPKADILTKYETSLRSITTVIELHKVVYLLHKEEDVCIVEMSLPDLTLRQKLFAFVNPSTKAASMAVSEKYIVVYVPAATDSRLLLMYDFSSKKCTSTRVPTLHIPYFLPDGHLLTVGFDELIKYSIKDGKLSLTWACKELPKACRVCVDSRGLIFVSTIESCKSIYVISPEGQKLRTITSNQLPVNTGNISIQGDQLAVSGWDSKKLHLYKFNYQ